VKNKHGNTITDPQDKAELLNGDFQSVYTTKDSDLIPDKGPFPHAPIPDIDMVYNFLSNYKIHKSQGSDSVDAHSL